MKADGQKEATGKTAPNAPAAQPGNSNVPQTAETGNPPDGGATTVAKPAETALPETGAPKNPRKTAAKSMAVPVKTEGDDGEDTESDADDETKEEPAETLRKLTCPQWHFLAPPIDQLHLPHSV